MSKHIVKLIRNTKGEYILPLPEEMVQKYDLSVGGAMEILAKENGEYILRPIERRPTLNKLLKGINKQNMHGEIDFGDSVGDEII
ncbi:AbrB/MazE/SpoVT family DNA-binding domain-containing protein [Saccharicrinis aurantiacus]|uniref:AbrB/MazE/SpoVT family DNA-binding domain-containing protein n=1 Tax=Saccharicrinis aurantiacus TaxID=1849719 RepID=UPI0024924026|nr:hypothetical protein [Saccharicrinis aurantiacus]